MRILFLLAICFSFSVTYAQDSTLKYSASLFLAGASDQTPFWFHANQNGTIPMDGTFASGRWAVYKVYNSGDPRIFQWSAGAEAITNFGTKGSGNVFFTDLYAAAKLGPVEFLAGQKKNITGITDTTLTSGSLPVAGNARPFPRLQISIPEFLPLGITNNIVSIKASYSDGILGSSGILYGSVRRVPNTYFHQKQIYFRFGKSSGRLKLYTGMNHQAIWGGEDVISPLYQLKPLKAYRYMVTGKTLDHKKVGNHFGTIDVAGEWKGRKWSYFLYRQNIYENSSLFKVINFTDGLNGIRVKRIQQKSTKARYFLLQSFLLECVGTQNQINAFSSSNLLFYENGNYFNSFVYQNGWSYMGRGIGTPLIPAANITKNTDKAETPQFSNNNRSWVFHGAITATWLNCSILMKGTFSRNLGTYLQPYDPARNQLSLLLSVEKKIPFLKNSTFIASIASDAGKLYPNSTGVLIGLRKSGYFN